MGFASMAVEPADLKLTPEICAALGLTQARELPKEVKTLGGDSAEHMCLIDNEGRNYCGHYALAVIGTLLYATVHKVDPMNTVVKVQSVIDNIRAYAMTLRETAHERQQFDLADKYSNYLLIPPHILESFEASWYLRMSDVNVVVMMRQKFRNKRETKNGTYLSEAVRYHPRNTYWVMLLHVDSCHWTNIAKRVAPMSTYSLFFTTDEIRSFLDKDFDFSLPWEIESTSPVATTDFIDLEGKLIPNKGKRTSRTSQRTSTVMELPKPSRRRRRRIDANRGIDTNRDSK
jgi:hypothetical protein